MKKIICTYATAQKRMIDGMISLLQYKSFLDITVKELCMVSNVNRTTFYAHYDNTYELLEDSQDYMINKFLDSFPNKVDINNLPKDIDFIDKEYLVPYLQFIKENKVIYETYAKNNITVSKNDFFSKIMENISKPVYKLHNIVNEVDLLYITRFYIDGITSIVNEWIKRDFEESEDYIASLIVKLHKNK